MRCILIVCLLLSMMGCTVLEEPVNEQTYLKEYQVDLFEDSRTALLCKSRVSDDVAVLLLQGSGRADADYTIEGVPLYRQLAYGLAEYGISSFRFDKRMFVDEQIPETIQKEILDDALTALEWLKKKYDVVMVLGHSLSAVVLPSLAEEADGMIFLSGAVSPLESVYAKQLMKQADQEEQKQILKEQEMISSLKEDTGFSWFGLPESWWLSVHQLNLESCFQQMTQPVLVLHGREDEQIDCIELKNYARVLNHLDEVELVLCEGLNHQLMSQDNLQLDKSVVDWIGTWILKTSSFIIEKKRDSK